MFEVSISVGGIKADLQGLDALDERRRLGLRDAGRLSGDDAGPGAESAWVTVSEQFARRWACYFQSSCRCRKDFSSWADVPKGLLVERKGYSEYVKLDPELSPEMVVSAWVSLAEAEEAEESDDD